jgi:uncharacterized protein with HEPN domain
VSRDERERLRDILEAIRNHVGGSLGTPSIDGLRDIIAHQYFRIQKQIIEDTVKGDLPDLLRAVDKLLA